MFDPRIFAVHGPGAIVSGADFGIGHATVGTSAVACDAIPAMSGPACGALLPCPPAAARIPTAPGGGVQRFD